MFSDPLYRADVCKHGVIGVVELIERGSVSRAKLYRVAYIDGDCEHLTLPEVEKYRIDLKQVAADLVTGRIDLDQAAAILG